MSDAGDSRKGALYGIVIALESEADAALGRGVFKPEGDVLTRRGVAGNDFWICALSGVGPGRAFKAAKALAGMGVQALGSIGVSGGLEPSLAPGVVVAATASREHIPGEVPETVWEGSIEALDSLVETLVLGKVLAVPGRLVTVPAPALTPAAKEFLRAEHDAVAVDMESSAVARAAREAGLPFFALRAICDAADREVPGDVLDAVAESGKTSILGVLKMIAKKPSLLPKLMTMGREYNRALKALSRAWAVLSKAGLSSIPRN